MAIKAFKPMIKPMTDQPVDISLFSSIYDAINSLNVADIDFVIDNWSEPWGDGGQQQRDTNISTSSTGLQLKILAGYFPVHDGSAQSRVGKRSWTINFPSSSSFTVNPVIVCTPVFAGANAEPTATAIQWADTRSFRVHAQSIGSSTVNITHFSYIAMGY